MKQNQCNIASEKEFIYFFLYTNKKRLQQCNYCFSIRKTLRLCRKRNKLDKHFKTQHMLVQTTFIRPKPNFFLCILPHQSPTFSFNRLHFNEKIIKHLLLCACAPINRCNCVHWRVFIYIHRTLHALQVARLCHKNYHLTLRFHSQYKWYHLSIIFHLFEAKERNTFN